MQTEYTYPSRGDRSSPKEWDKNGRPDLLVKAIKRKNKLLSNPSKATFSSEIDK